MHAIFKIGAEEVAVRASYLLQWLKTMDKVIEATRKALTHSQFETIDIVATRTRGKLIERYVEDCEDDIEVADIEPTNNEITIYLEAEPFFMSFHVSNAHGEQSDDYDLVEAIDLLEKRLEKVL